MPDMRVRAALLALVTVFGVLVSGALAGPAGARETPSPTSSSPTEPLPVDIRVKPDSDVLGQPGLHVAEGMTRPPGPIPATAYLVVDVDSGDVLVARNARAQLLPASTLKVLTALALSPELPDDREYTASADAANIEGSRVGLVQGSQYTVRDLFFGLMLSSGNDAAIALHELVGGQPQAAELMNAKAAELGASDTFAVNTSGLDGPEQYTSARDLAIFGRAMLDDPRVSAVAGTKLYDFPGPGAKDQPGRQTFQIVNHNRMLGTYPGATGGKTGYTANARGTFIGTASRDGRRLACTVLHSEGMEYEHCQKLLDWAYSQPAPEHPATTLAASIEASAPPRAEPTGGDATSTSPGATSPTADPRVAIAGRSLPPWALPAAGGAVLLLLLAGWFLKRLPSGRRARHRRRR